VTGVQTCALPICPLTWDGGSPSYYLAFNDPPSDAEVFSPQVEAMNYDFMLREAFALNPGFWFELSTWNGCDWYPMATAPSTNGDCNTLNANTPNYTADRYAGMVQFAMWLARPRVVRDFRGYAEPRSQNEPLFDVLMNAVDRVYTNGTLTTFWRSGQLLANTSRPHPYQQAIPTEYQAANRMFLLTTNLDPPQPWSLTTPLPIYALARQIGTAPTRQWLLYTFAPNGPLSGVQITIPGYRTVTADATAAGAFYLVDEAMGLVSSLGNGDPGSGNGPIPGGDSFDTIAPTVSITSPGTGTILIPGPVSVTVNANDNVGVSRVELWAAGQLVGSTNVAPYNFIWDTSAYVGDVDLVAYAYDAAGNRGASARVTASVRVPLIDEIISPQANSKVSGTVALAATATEHFPSLQVASLAIHVDGKLHCSAPAATVSCHWRTKSAAYGAHTILAIAEDTGGNRATASISVTK